jgi:CDP-diacylglycerol---serine O-phosphatidyltransferase
VSSVNAPPRRPLIPVLPTALTLGNLVCGFIAIAKTVDALQGAARDGGPLDPLFADRIVQACWFVLAAMVFDALDGRVARLMNQASPFGTQLDSLADVVTFGMAPALLAKVSYEHTMNQLGLPFHHGVVTLLCSMFTIGAALRLARFNVTTTEDEDSHDTFLGLPSPAAAATVITTCIFIFIGRQELGLGEDAASTLAVLLLRSLPGLACGLGLLMFSRVRYVHLAQRYIKSRTRFGTFAWMVLIGWIVVLFHEWLLFAVSMTYVVGGLVIGLRARARGRSPVESLPAPWDPDDDEAVAP